jgi:uncharacterized membrane protein
MDSRTFGERVSDSVAKFGGSWWFISSGAIVIILWVSINTISLLTFKWDEYPFILLNLFLSLIAAFQAPFILMAQRRCEIKQDLIYRSLFREIKELVEADLSLEHEIIDKNENLEAELMAVRQELRTVKNIMRRLLKNKEE